MLTKRDAWEFDAAMAEDDLKRHFRLHSLDGLGVEHNDKPALKASGALLKYALSLQPSGLPQIGFPSIRRGGKTMPLDTMTKRNLELEQSLRSDTPGGTLIEVIDRTVTPMGKRLLRQWLLAPPRGRDSRRSHDRCPSVHCRGSA